MISRFEMQSTAGLLAALLCGINVVVVEDLGVPAKSLVGDT